MATKPVHRSGDPQPFERHDGADNPWTQRAVAAARRLSPEERERLEVPDPDKIPGLPEAELKRIVVKQAVPKYDAAHYGDVYVSEFLRVTEPEPRQDEADDPPPVDIGESPLDRHYRERAGLSREEWEALQARNSSLREYERWDTAQRYRPEVERLDRAGDEPSAFEQAQAKVITKTYGGAA